MQKCLENVNEERFRTFSFFFKRRKRFKLVMGCTSTKVVVEEKDDLLEKVWNEFCLASFRTKRIENVHDLVLEDEDIIFIGYFNRSDMEFTDAGILNSKLENASNKKCSLAIVCDNVDIPTYFDAYMIVKQNITFQNSSNLEKKIQIISHQIDTTISDIPVGMSN
jgi:hypothetical protein